MKFTIPIKTKNPLNGSQGRTRGAVFGQAAKRRKERDAVHFMWLAAHGEMPTAPWVVKLTRIAPRPLDGHDGLRASLKAVVDQLAVELGLPVNAKGHAQDSDPRVTWAYAQRRGKVREYAVEVEIVSEQVKETGPNVPRETSGVP